MLDRIRGKKDDEDKKSLDLRSNNDKKDDDPDIGERLKGMVSRVSGGKDADQDDEKKEPPKRKMPRPMPRPIKKADESPRLRPPPKKPEDKKPRGGLGGFGRRAPDDDDQRTLIGAAVFAVIFIVLIGAGYYFFVYSPYQTSLGDAKQTKLNEVNTYYQGPLATDPSGINLRLQIDGATTPDQVNAIDVLTPATTAWRNYQNQQIDSQKDQFGRVEVVYSAGTQKNVILKVADAQTLVSQSDASVLSNIQIKTPDTVAIPILVNRTMAAGGLINVGNSVDVYLNPSSSANASQNTSQLNNTPNISGATVLAILRAKDSGAINANKSAAQSIAINNLISSSARSQSANEDVEQLLSAAAANNWDQSEVSNNLNSYGWKLSDFERTSNLGDLNAQYLILLEVPREDALFLIQNQYNVILTVPTENAPTWMINELKSIYS